MADTFITAIRFPMTFDPARLQADVERTLKHNWSAHYSASDYTGGWDVISLMSYRGRSEWIQAAPVAGFPAELTEIMQDCRYFREVLDGFLFEKTSARLMRLEAGAVIKPHRDYCLGYEDGTFRIHIPVVTNADVEFIVAGERLIMEEGTCWYINASEEHSVANHGTQDRIHLVIDGRRNAWTDALFFAQAQEEQLQRPPKPMSEDTRRQVIESLRRMGDPASEALVAKLEQGLL